MAGNYCRPCDTASWQKKAALYRMIVRKLRQYLALPTAASAGLISGDLGTSAALDTFSTVYELPLMRLTKAKNNYLKDTINCGY